MKQMHRTKSRLLMAFVLLGPAIFAFQNCSNNYSLKATGSMAGELSNGAGDPVIPVPGNNTGSTQVALSSVRPVFAVRGINCVACHGIVGSNVVTDFGYGTANFQTSNAFFTGARTAFDNVDVGNGVGGWGSLTVAGSIIVPNVTIPQAQASTMFASQNDISLEQVLQMPNPNSHSSAPMITGVTPAAGQPAVIPKANVKITYPSVAEILALLPAPLQSADVAVAPVTVSGFPATVMSGFATDASGHFARNSTGSVTCTGDVVVKGPLLLKNLNLTTDANGCRLYVTQTVFIQGPITYSGGASSANLQITSARGIMMGLSSKQMGAVPGLTFTQAATAATVRTNQSVLTTPGGPWPRFALGEELEYNPGGAPVNGLASVAYFNALVIDALSMDSELYDAGDSAAVSNLVPGETTVTEAASSANAGLGGTRVAINYTGLILNAPHVHSRYGGSLKGAIIADVVMLARNPTSAATIEQFQYDPLIDSLAVVFPALKTDVLVVQ